MGNRIAASTEQAAPRGEKSHRARGARAEQEAAAHLTALGWRVLVCNWTVRQGELDVVAMDGDTLVFVEVKARATRSAAQFGGALASVTPTKRRRLTAAALRYLAEEAPPHVPARFDVMYRDGAQEPWTLVQDAFRAEELG